MREGSMDQFMYAWQRKDFRVEGRASLLVCIHFYHTVEWYWWGWREAEHFYYLDCLPCDEKVNFIHNYLELLYLGFGKLPARPPSSVFEDAVACVTSIWLYKFHVKQLKIFFSSTVVKPNYERYMKNKRKSIFSEFRLILIIVKWVWRSALE